MRVLVAALLAGVAIACTAGAGAAPALEPQQAVFGGLGTWVDIYDGGVFAAPERTAARMAARDVTTVWVETANDRSAVDVVRPARLGLLVDALHAQGVKVVAW